MATRVKRGKGVEIRVTDHGAEALFIRINRAAKILPCEVGVIDADEETARLAAYHEMGTATVPQRSFLRRTMEIGRSRYAKISKWAYGRFLDGDWTIQQALAEVGNTIKSDIQARILRGIAPPLRRATVEHKIFEGMVRPRTALYATGKLFNSIKMRLPKWAGR